MNSEFQQYRFARIEAENIAHARLEAQFENGVADIGELENAVAQLLASEPQTCVPWHRSEMEQIGAYDGIRLAALEFFWSRRQELQSVSLNPVGPQTDKVWDRYLQLFTIIYRQSKPSVCYFDPSP